MPTPRPIPLYALRPFPLEPVRFHPQRPAPHAPLPATACIERALWRWVREDDGVPVSPFFGDDERARRWMQENVQRLPLARWLHVPASL